MTEITSLEMDQDLSNINIDTNVLLFVDKDFALRRNLVPYKFEDNTLYLATNKPENILETMDILRIIQKKSPLVKNLIVQLTNYENITAGCNKAYGSNPAAATAYSSSAIKKIDTDNAGEVSTEITKLVDQIIAHARNANASDIHITPVAAGAIVQFRINGRLIMQDFNIREGDKETVVNRIKSLAAMDTAQSHVAADGSFTLNNIDFRVNTFPCGEYGEKVNIRLLNSDSGLKKLNKIGFPDADLKLMEEIVARPYGIVLMTGPTGHGKSTTLYACLRERGSEENVVISAEDPVEQHIDGAAQSPIKVNTENEKLSWTFEKAIRAMMRQDPDIILIGEIRDKPTAITAIQASQTGHLVFATLHTRSAIGSVQRMMDIGVDRNSFLAEMNAIIAQRLVAVNCPHCQQKIVSSYNRFLRKQDLARLVDGQFSYESPGCDKCGHTGIASSRLPIVEIIKFTNDLRDFFSEKRGLRETEKYLRTKGYRSLWDKGMDLVAEGKLSLRELCGVLTPDEDLETGDNTNVVKNEGVS